MASMMVQVVVGGGSELGDVEAAQAGIDQSGTDTSPGPEYRQLAKSLWGMGFVIIVMSAGMFLHQQPPHVAPFDRHPFAYYLTLASIFVAGVAEVWIAFWVSQSHDGRRYTFGRAALYVYVIVLAIVFGLGGSTILFKE
ncbi:hypothetical protein ABZP36_016498 [Zizania latifolia]